MPQRRVRAPKTCPSNHTWWGSLKLSTMLAQGVQLTANGFVRTERAPGFFGKMKGALCGAL